MKDTKRLKPVIAGAAAMLAVALACIAVIAKMPAQAKSCTALFAGLAIAGTALLFVVGGG